MKKLTLTTQHTFTNDEWEKYLSTFGTKERKELILKGGYERGQFHGDGQFSHTTAKLEDVTEQGIDNIGII